MRNIAFGFAVYLVIGCIVIALTLNFVETSTFTDYRDGKKYRTAKIGEQVWMAENLNYAAEGSKCYENDPAECDKHGRLYNWETALKACPKGWHLPTEADWDELLRYVDNAGGTITPYESETAAKYLKATSGWKEDYKGTNYNGTDDYGFAALPGRVGFSDGGFSSLDGSVDWWSAEEANNNSAYVRRINTYGYDVYVLNIFKKVLIHARCLKNNAKPLATPEPVLIETSTLADPRDGKKYKAVKIGKQVWMAENLNYAAEGSVCYDNDPANCDKYGRLYNWETAGQACPKGWHLPENIEWDELNGYADGSNITELPHYVSPYRSEWAGRYLKAASGWDGIGNGKDKFGFAALPSAYDIAIECGNSINAHDKEADRKAAIAVCRGIWWSASASNKCYCKECCAYGYGMSCMLDMALPVGSHLKKELYSVRCVRDLP